MKISIEGLGPVLTRAEEAALALRIQNGPDPIGARNELVVKNQRLVYRLVKNRVSPNHRDFEDIYQEAMIGLMRAAENFDPARGLKFSTYARWYIKRNTLRALGKSTVVRVPRRQWGKDDLRREESLSDFVEEIAAPPVDEDPEEIAEDIRDCLDVLNPSELDVIRSRFNLDGWHDGFCLAASFDGSEAERNRVYQSAITKLRQAYEKHLAA